MDPRTHDERAAKLDDAAVSRMNAVSLMTRREIEARIVAPLLEAMGREFGRERVLEIAREVVVEIAREHGEQLAQASPDRSLVQFSETLENWKKDNALEMDMLEVTDSKLSFNVTRCLYAEMYRAVGIPELGALLSCNRDWALIQGFNPEATLTREHTIMQGAAFCPFRYEIKPKAEPGI